MTFQLNGFIGYHLQLRIAATLLIFQTLRQHRQIFFRIIAHDDDDCFLPGFSNHDEKDLARKAVITASSAQPDFAAANIVSGVSRRYEGAQNAWRSDGMSEDGEWIQLQLDQPAKVSQVQLTFDSNFDLEKKITLSSRRQNQQIPGVPPELVKNCTIELLMNGSPIASQKIENNHLRLRRVSFESILCDAVRVRVDATNGAAEARIFEVRIYE